MAFLKNISIVFLLLCSHFMCAQEKLVRLVEEKLKKRTILYVQNDTDKEKSVFLKVDPKGYRRSANKPILKIIPPKKKIQMMILIPLTNKESYYTYNLIVNDNLETIEVKRKKQ